MKVMYHSRDKSNALLFVFKGHGINPFPESENQALKLYGLHNNHSVNPEVIESLLGGLKNWVFGSINLLLKRIF